MTNVTRTVSDSAANATEQMERFESLYNSFFENHVLQLLYLTERQVECLVGTLCILQFFFINSSL